MVSSGQPLAQHKLGIPSPIPGGAACRDHDQQLHQPLVDVAGGGGLNDEDIFVANRLADREGGFLVRVVEGDGAGDLDAESAGSEGDMSAV